MSWSRSCSELCSVSFLRYTSSLLQRNNSTSNHIEAYLLNSLEPEFVVMPVVQCHTVTSIPIICFSLLTIGLASSFCMLSPCWGISGGHLDGVTVRRALAWIADGRCAGTFLSGLTVQEHSAVSSWHASLRPELAVGESWSLQRFG